MNSSSDTRRPAERLEGEILPNGWTVTKSIERATTSTGGRFSTPYIVRSKSGEEAFLKAMDYTEALDSEDPAKLLESMTRAYNFERDLLEKCQTIGCLVLSRFWIPERFDPPEATVVWWCSI